MRTTALNAWHIAHGATMTDFNGWHMPLYYKGITEEHHHTRARAGLFDLGHMGRVFIKGADRLRFVDFLTPAKTAEARPGDVQYSFLLRENGTIIDDITIYYDPEWILLVINAGNRDRDVEWIREQAARFEGDVVVDDKCDSWTMVAIQGPTSLSVMNALFGGAARELGYYKFANFDNTLAAGPLVISRTGYTGEDGFEIYGPTEYGDRVWDALLGAEPAAEVHPIGLGARDSLRLEAGMPLYGHELDDETTPLHAGLGKFVDLEKGDFIGKGVLAELKAAGPERKLIGFEMTQRGPVARQGFGIYDGDGNRVGMVTSGIFSPTLQKTVGMGYVSPEVGKIGTPIQVEIRGRMLPAVVTRRAFYKRGV